MTEELSNMTHPTDDELEAMAVRLDGKTHNMIEGHAQMEDAAAMLRACKGRNDWFLIRYDNGDAVYLSSFSGGAAPYGVMGELTLMKEDSKGNFTFRKYRSISDWQSGLQKFTSPDHSDWNAAIEAAANVAQGYGCCHVPQEIAEEVLQLKKGSTNV